jgi:hypothetical protein
MADEPKPGPTGRYPDGKKLTDDDDGELQVTMHYDNKNKHIVVEFGCPVTWLALGANDAMQLARMLVEQAMYAQGAQMMEAGDNNDNPNNTPH